MKDQGFTLIEFLITVGILSILSLAGSQAISNVILARGVIIDRQSEMADVRRLMSLMRHDLDNRLSTNTEAGVALRPSPSGSTLAFPIHGVLSDPTQPIASRGHVEWSIDNNTNQITRTLMTPADEPLSTEQFDEIETVDLAVFENGTWQQVTPGRQAAASQSNGVSITLTHTTLGALQIVSAK